MMRHLCTRTLVIVMAVCLPWVVAAQAGSQAGQAQTQTQTGTPPPLAAEFAPKPYTVGPDDRVSLRFFNVTADDMDMSNAYLVQADGTIQLKYGNPLKVQGMTVLEIHDAVMKLLVPNFYQKGVVTLQVEVTEEREQRVFVQGHVMSPGEKRLKGSQMTVNRAIFTAGGFSTTAGQEVDVQRENKTVLTVTRTQLENGDDPALQEGDTVAVRQGTFYFINGEVANPGKKPWEV
jgi:protein involved in polysaccharide export with SLBB domain